MAIQFTISRRGKLHTDAPAPIIDPTTGKYKNPETGETVDPLVEQARTYYPRLRGSGKPVDAAAYFRDTPWPTRLTEGDVILCLDEIRRLLLHELCNGSSVHLPGIGTLSLTLAGDIELRGADYHGRNVRVEGLRFTPAPQLLKDVRAFEVEQTPFGQAYFAEQVDIDGILDDLFSRQATITRRDLEVACGLVVSKHRLSDLLSRYVTSGRLVKEGRGNQTRYRRP